MRAKTALTTLALLASLCLAACNTIEGVGKDISSAARGTAEAFDKVTH